MRLAETFNLGSAARTAWSFGPLGASAAEHAHRAVYAIMPECVCLAMPRAGAANLRTAGHGARRLLRLRGAPAADGRADAALRLRQSRPAGHDAAILPGFGTTDVGGVKGFFRVPRRGASWFCGGVCATGLLWSALTRSGTLLRGASEHGVALLYGAREERRACRQSLRRDYHPLLLANCCSTSSTASAGSCSCC